MKIIAEDTYHRPAIADVVVCTGIRRDPLAHFIRDALQREYGESECRTYRVVSDATVPYTPKD